MKFSSQIENVKDSYDWDFFGHGELCYEMASCAYRLFSCRFCMNSWEGNSNLYYCDLCLGDENLFGCVGLRKKRYCILNKQYAREEYEKLVPKIIEHMQKTEEWGEFPPARFSPFAYNNSVAFEYYPLAKEEVEHTGLKWREPDAKDYRQQNVQTPDNIRDVSDEIINEVYSCITCNKNFKILEQELRFYREFQIPLPEHCWLCRHKKRMSLRNPRVIYSRSCQKCGANIYTTYSPQKPEKIFCEKCYLREVA